MAVVPNSEDVAPQRLQQKPPDAERHEATYWLAGSKVFFGGGYPIRHARIETFVFYAGGFAKDERACYIQDKRLIGADPSAFRALNYAFATDGSHVWCIAGKVKDADAASFTVCDDGRYVLDPTCVVPHSYARDSVNVYFYNFDGIAHIVRGADATSFRSLGDGIFGVDETSVFAEAYRLKGVKSSSWRKLGGKYSTDGKYIYFLHYRMEVGDLATFSVVPSRWDEHTNWAMDANHRFQAGRPISENDLTYKYWLDDAAVELAIPANDA
jgi:DKNYY family